MAINPEKALLYTKELDRVRLRGDWVGDAVAQKARGKRIGWAELLRKYGKHNPGKEATVAIVAIEQSLRSSLVAFYREEGYSDLSHGEDDASAKQGTTLFPPNLPPRRSGHGWSGAEYQKTAAQLEKYPSDAASDDGDQHGIVAMYAHALFTLGRNEDAVALLHDSLFLETVNTDQVSPEEQGDQYQSALFMMGFVTYGMANERLHYLRPTAGYHPFAFAGYARAIELHEELRGGKKAKALPGLPEDEIERWAETALYRNALLSVREGDASLGLDALRAYQAHVSRWPKDFRLPQRNVINRTYLHQLNSGLELDNYLPPPAAPGKSRDDWRSQAYQRAVVASVASRVYIRDFVSERNSKSGLGRRTETYGTGHKALISRTVSTRRPFPARRLGPPSSVWANEMQTVSRLAAANVLRSSEFPRAGKVNLSALLLAEELFKGWQYNGELGGEHSDELVESFYTLSRLTFHSQRISRHLFTLLTASEAYAEAKCALELYISIVDKAREGDAAGSAALVEENKLREKKVEEEGYDLEEVKKEQEEAENLPEDKSNSKEEHAGGISEKARKAASQVSIDADDDATFADTLLTGAHVLLKYLNDATTANAMAEKALALLPQDSEKRKAAAKLEPVARALRIAGESRAAFALHTAAPEQLPALRREALVLLQESVQLDGQSSEGWFAFAYLQAQMGEIKSAIGSVRKAIELEPADIKCWHLLVLLVSATKDFDAAFKLAEVALDEAEADDEADRALPANGAANGNGSTNGKAGAGAQAISRSQLLSVDFPPTTLERAESILQLMVTQNVLEELIAGTDVSIGSQKDLFLFFHDRIAIHVSAAPANRGGLPAGEENSGPLPSRAHGLARLLHFGGGKKGAGTASGMGRSGAVGGREKKTSAESLSGSLDPSSLNGDGVVAVDGAAGSGDGSRAFAISSPLATSATPADARKAYRSHKETTLLSDLWLLSSATFRRSSQLAQARIAIQEAERLDAGRPHLWTQLALLSEKVGEVSLAVEALHKALACDRDFVPASVHLARLYLTREEELLPLKNTTLTTTVAVCLSGKQSAKNGSGEKDSTRSRCIAGDLVPSSTITGSNATTSAPRSATTTTNGLVGGETNSNVKDNGNGNGNENSSGNSDPDTVGDILESRSTKNTATLSLAEGLLLTSTTTPAAAAATPEAWLFLAQVYQKTQRRQRARECLRYALRLEETRMVRTLDDVRL